MSKESKVAPKVEAQSEAKVVKLKEDILQVTCAQNVKMAGAKVMFQANVPQLVTQEAFDKMCEMPNFKALVDKGVVKVGV